MYLKRTGNIIILLLADNQLLSGSSGIVFGGINYLIQAIGKSADINPVFGTGNHLLMHHLTIDIENADFTFIPIH